jgi:hypothetical protein
MVVLRKAEHERLTVTFRRHGFVRHHEGCRVRRSQIRKHKEGVLMMLWCRKSYKALPYRELPYRHVPALEPTQILDCNWRPHF